MDVLNTKYKINNVKSILYKILWTITPTRVKEGPTRKDQIINILRLLFRVYYIYRFLILWLFYYMLNNPLFLLLYEGITVCLPPYGPDEKDIKTYKPQVFWLWVSQWYTMYVTWISLFIKTFSCLLFSLRDVPIYQVWIPYRINTKVVGSLMLGSTG